MVMVREEDAGVAQTSLNLTNMITIDSCRKTDSFTVVSMNVRSMSNKFQKIRDVTHKISFTILCLQETWGKILRLIIISKNQNLISFKVMAWIWEFENILLKNLLYPLLFCITDGINKHHNFHSFLHQKNVKKEATFVSQD